MGGDNDENATFLDVDFANIFVMRMDNRLRYVSLTSNLKRAHKKRRDRLCDKRLYENGLGGLLALRWY